ncbi:MAG: phenylalanine--tRNA ligase subunit beta [Phycisphaerae bacterium]|nr:phenylalanine--tRNA ligase subunit beta [Phycisphaerae bacterium]
MLISLNWIKDFVAIPDAIAPKDLALQFTITTAEVEGVEEHLSDFEGVIAARIESIRTQPGDGKLKTVIVDAGGSRRYTSVTTAPDVAAGDMIAYAPPGARVGAQTLGEKDAAGRDSQGMIVAWGAIGFPHIGAHAIRLPAASDSAASGFTAGDPVAAEVFADWVIEVDNKSITHRPDCWGHFGIAREIAAMLRLPLKPIHATPTASLINPSGTPVPIEIDDSDKCPRYSALAFTGLRVQPSPLWMQARLALCGMRPIDLIVDLTNYVMLELGQPMHAFDGEKVKNIQVAVAKPGEIFRTLDGIDRALPNGALMIQTNRKNVAIAGIMGGAETEVGPETTTILLESANFDAPTIRRTATAMGHRTEASARFEKSLDPTNTVLGIARFHALAVAERPQLKIASALSDCYPSHISPTPITVDCDFAARFIGPLVGDESVTPSLMIDILSRLEFACRLDGNKLTATPPTFRATKDISIEADLLEEIARFVGYNNIAPALPRVSARHFEPSKELDVEHRTLNHLCIGGGFIEVHNYIWYDDVWLRTIGHEAGECITLRNPAADHCSRLRRSLVPGLIAMAESNRHHHDRFQLVEIGSVFEAGHDTVETSQQRRMGLLVAQQGKKTESLVWDQLRLALAGWARQITESDVSFKATKAAAAWEDADRIAEIVLDRKVIGRATILPASLLLKIDERLRSWSFAVAEVDLAVAAGLLERFEKLPLVPRHPQAELDFSVIVDAGQRYESVAEQLSAYRHELMRQLAYIGAYEGGAIPEGKRSLLFRARIGCDDRTLTDVDIQSFSAKFRDFLAENHMELRG